MKRPRQHIMEQESALLIKSVLPSEWIVREVALDYGIDWEVEVVDNGEVTGHRFWIQAKSVENSLIRREIYEFDDRIDDDDLRYRGEGIGYSDNGVYADYISYPIESEYLRYALQCHLPLLLFVCCLDSNRVYWIPLRDAVIYQLNAASVDWRLQKTVTLRVPCWSELHQASESNYYGLRWYAEESARVYSLASLGYVLDNLSSKTGLQFRSGSEFYAPTVSHDASMLKAMVAALQQIADLQSLHNERGLLLTKITDWMGRDLDGAKEAIASSERFEEGSDIKLEMHFQICLSLLMVAASASSLYYETGFTHILTRASAIMRYLS